MESLCPLCMKNGTKSRIKSFQINLEEAVWACEDENCVWPIGYEELIFFERKAISCNWEESNLIKKSIPLPIELSLYTPPVTPGGGESSRELTDINMESFPNTLIEDKFGETLNKNESISSTKEVTGSNQVLLLEPFKLESNNSTDESRNIVKKKKASVSAFRTLPKITNTQTTNIDLSSISEYYNNKKIQEQRHSFVDTKTADIMKDIDSLFDNTCKEFNLSMLCKDSEQSKSDTVQLYDTASGVETNFSTEMLSQTMKPTTDVNVINNLNKTNDFILNTSGNDLNIDTMLEGILIDENNTISIDDDWLNSLMS